MRDDRNENERKADALLAVARCWQNDMLASDCGVAITPEADMVLESTPGWTGLNVHPYTTDASAALSEVCHGLGFELEPDK